jgi:hypothetical protein
MAQPIIIQDVTLRNYLQSFRSTFSMPQWKYFVTVLMGMIHCQASRTLRWSRFFDKKVGD